MESNTSVVSARGLRKEYGKGAGLVRAVEDVTLDVAAGGHVHQAIPPALTLLAVIPGTLIVVAVLTAIPARIGARRPVADVLRSE